MRLASAGVTTILVAFLSVHEAHAQESAAGKRIAEATCSGCHLVDPQDQKVASDAVPTFASIARMPSTTGTSLTAFLSTPHTRMPDIILNHEEIADLAAYILSLRETP